MEAGWLLGKNRIDGGGNCIKPESISDYAFYLYSYFSKLKGAPFSN